MEAAAFMKKSGVVVLVLTVLSFALILTAQKNDGQTPAPQQAGATPGIFDANDLVVNDVRFGERPEEVEKKLGQPKSAGREEMIPATGDEYYAVEYDGLELRFFLEEEDKRSLRFAEISSSRYTGPRGLKVGDTKEAVIAAFPSPRGHEGLIPDVEILYAASVSGDTALPPMGEIGRAEDTGGETVSYICPTSPYEEQAKEMGAWDIYLDYVYLEHAIAWFEIEDGKVVLIRLLQSALAE